MVLYRQIIFSKDL